MAFIAPILTLITLAGPSPTRFATSRDGTRIAYDITGTGPALILLHGGGGNRRDWHGAGYVSRLSSEFTVITIDQRGSGESEKPLAASAYAVDELVDDVLAVADAAGAQRFALWGFSSGANIGRYVVVRSDRVRSMVYIGINFGPAADGIFRERILEERAKATPQDSDTKKLQLAWLSAMLDYPPVEPRDMKCPTLWMMGTKNEGAYASLKAYAGRLDGTRVEAATLDGLTHPQEFNHVDATLPKALAFTKAHP